MTRQTATKSLIFIVLISLAHQRLYFATPGADSGHIIPHLKEKFGFKDITEDSYAKLSWAMLVADGLGGPIFNSYHMASATTSYLAYSLLQMYPNGQIAKAMTNLHRYITGAMEKELQGYYDSLTAQLNSIAKKRGANIRGDQSRFDAATTFVSIFLVEDKEKNYVQILQRGDSLAGVFRLSGVVDKSAGKNYYSYRPIFVSNEQQGQFNAPYNFMGGDGCYEKSLGNESFEVFDTDIAIAGSDGLWDNLPLEAITFVVNALILAKKKKVQPRLALSALKGFSMYYQINADAIFWQQVGNWPNILMVNPQLGMSNTQYSLYLYQRMSMSLSDRNAQTRMAMDSVFSNTWSASVGGVKPPVISMKSLRPWRALPADYDPNLFRIEVDDGTGEVKKRQRNLAAEKAGSGRRRLQRRLMKNQGLKPQGAQQNMSNRQYFSEKTPGMGMGPQVSQNNGYNNYKPTQNLYNPPESQFNKQSVNNMIAKNLIGKTNYAQPQMLKGEGDRGVPYEFNPLQDSVEMKAAREAFNSCDPQDFFGGGKNGYASRLVEGLSDKWIKDCFYNAMTAGFKFTSEDIQTFVEEFDGKELSTLLAEVALDFSEDKTYLSPFQANLRRWRVQDNYQGGKPDDITVVADMLMEGNGWDQDQLSEAEKQLKNMMTMSDLRFKMDVRQFVTFNKM